MEELEGNINITTQIGKVKMYSSHISGRMVDESALSCCNDSISLEKMDFKIFVTVI